MAKPLRPAAGSHGCLEGTDEGVSDAGPLEPAPTIQHFFAANYPTSIFEGSFCDINAFFNCDSSAHSAFAAVFGVPIGWFGIALGGLVALGGVQR